MKPFSTEAGTSSNRKNDTLTIESFEELLDVLYPVLYYATDKNLEPGSFYHVDEMEFNPEFIVCHPDDFEAVKSKITARRLVHIKDEPPEKQMERVLKSLEKRYRPMNNHFFTGVV